jgi:hypothetical protein
MRHWSLILVEYCPLRFPFRATKRFEFSPARVAQRDRGVEDSQPLLRLLPEQFPLAQLLMLRLDGRL